MINTNSLYSQSSPINESFSNLGPYGGYQTETWTGDDGGTWTATDARTDQNINGDAICMRNGVLTSPTVSGGIGSLTVTTQRKFSGSSGNMEVRVNGVAIGNIPYDGNVQTTTIPNINITGNIIVEIDATNSSSDRPAIDDLSWTAYALNDPQISNISINPASPSSTDDVSVSADIIDADGIASAEIRWGTSSGSLSNTISMSNIGGNTFQTTTNIPAQSYATTIFYEVYAIDNSSDDNTSAENSYTINALGGFSISMSDDGEINESNEDTEVISISISGETFVASLDLSNWSFSNLPNGVSVGALNRINNTQAEIILSGNRTKDYDANITNFTIEIDHQEFTTLSGASEIISNGITFIADNDAESISLSQNSPIIEGSENGEIIIVDLSGGTFADPLDINNWSLNNQPSNVSIGSLNRISSTKVEIVLSGNTSTDYDADITNAEISIDADEIDDHTGSDISENSGIVFTAIIEAAPTAQASDIVFTSLNSNSISLNWTRGNGENCIVVCKHDSEVDIFPADGFDYNADNSLGSGDDLGSGNFVVYNGAGNSLTVNNLIQGEKYHFRVFEFNNSSTNTKYNTSNNTNNPDSSVTAPNNVTNFNIDCISKTTAKISWTPPDGQYHGVVIAMRESTNQVHTINGKGDTISANTVFGSGYEFGLTSPKSYVVYNGNSNQVEVTGLNPGSEYTFKAITYFDDIWSSGTTKSAQKAEIPEISNLSNYAPSGKMVISWSNPIFSCADEVMVVMKEASAITTNPNGDGSLYSANSVFTSGTDIGTNEYVVYKGVGNNVEVTGLTNGVEYYFKIFIRDGTDWSDGVEDSNTPDDISILFPGDLAIVSVNTNSSGGDDEISIICFDTLKTGTAIDLTDNGWERDNTDKWGNTEGTIRFTRTGPDIPPGVIFTFTGSGYRDTDFSASGLSNNSWSISSLNGNYSLNLNTSDQLWIMQYGSWNAGTTNNHDATYSGNILYGWTATGWAGDPSHGSPGSTSYSAIYPNTNCLSSNVSGTSDKDRVKYTGPTTAATKREWIQRFNNSANWTGYSNTANHQAASPQYHIGETFTILPNAYSDGEWIGDRDSNWFYCGNWGTLEVPDENTDVLISSNSQRSAIICSSADYSDDFSDTAHSYNLTIEQDSIVLKSIDDVLNIKGNLNIDGGVLNPNSGKINIQGNWTSLNENSFVKANSIVNFNGSAQQSISIFAGSESFNRIYIDNSNGIILNNTMESDSLIFKKGKVFIENHDFKINIGVDNADNSKYIVTKNSKSSSASLIMGAGNSNTIFPIGTINSYNPINIKTTSGGSVDYKVRTFDTIYENGYGGNALLGKVVYKSFAIELNSSPTATADIGLQWNFLDEDASFSHDRNSALIIHNPANGSGNLWDDWSIISNSSSALGSGPYNINATGITNFGVFGVVVRCEILKPNTSAIYHY